MLTSSPTFCPSPWIALNIDHSGSVKPCLASYEAGQELGNINQATIQEILAGDRLRKMKQTMAQGEWDPLCAGCQRLELQNCSSPRQQIQVAPEVITAIGIDPAYFSLTNLTINWSNLCNLTCTYCNPETSTAWQSKLKIPISLLKNRHEDLIELAKQHSKTITGLTLGGGEPLLQKGLTEFLKHLRSEQTNVMITTNLSTDLDRSPVYQELRNWPRVSWLISFDNADADRFEYVRNPADWQQFYSNILQLKADQQKVVAHPAYSIYCAHSLVSYCEFCLEHDLEIFWCDLKHPYALDIRRSTAELRLQAKKEIDRVFELYQQHAVRLGLSTLDTYRVQLEALLKDPVSTLSNILDPAAWHAKQEAVLNQKHKFIDLWPQFGNL